MKTEKWKCQQGMTSIEHIFKRIASITKVWKHIEQISKRTKQVSTCVKQVLSMKVSNRTKKVAETLFITI